jgi:predicted ferric reductase
MSTTLSSSNPISSTVKWGVIITSLGLVFLSILVGTIGIVMVAQAFPAAAEKAYWFVSRSSGLLAYGVITVSVMWGLVQSGALMRRVIPPALALGLHNFLSWLGLALSGLHALILLGDHYINFTLAQLLIPFSATYEPVWTGLGTIALYLIVLLILSFYARPYLGQKTFRAFHYTSFVAFFLVTLHSLGAGSDTGLMTPFYIVCLSMVVVMTLWRVANRALARLSV